MKKIIVSLFMITLMAITAFSGTNGFIGYHESGTDFLIPLDSYDFSNCIAGTDIDINMMPTENCYIMILMNRPDGKTVLLTPNAFNTEMVFKAGTHARHLGTAGVYPFEEEGFYNIQLLASTHSLSFFETTKEDFDKARQPFFEFKETAEELKILSRMQTSPAWIAQSLVVNVVNAKGNLELNTVPEGATIMIDGVEKGMTPMNLTLKAGGHELILKKAGFDNLKENVFINANQSLGKTYTLKTTGWFPTKKEFLIDSFPVGAKIMVDGKDMGETPQKITVDYGRHVISLFRDGYETFSDYITVDADTITFKKDLIKPVNLPPHTGTLTVNIMPEGCEWKLDGVVQKKTTLIVNNGQHVIEVTKNNYETFTQIFRVEKGTTKEIPINLIPEMGTLYVNVENTFAKIFVNGEEYEKTPNEIKLTEGKYEITLIAPGFRTITRDVNIRPGQREEVKVKMQTAPNKF
jgi:hypothetical protein